MIPESPLSAPPPPAPEPQAMPIGGGRRLALGAEGVTLEVRSPTGAWVTDRLIRYDEIRAVYAYEARDWAYLVVAGGYWVAGLLLWAFAFFFSEWSAPVLWIALAVLTVLAVGLAVYRIMTVPRPLLRIDAYGGPLTVPHGDLAFFRRLSARLPRPDTVPDLGGTA